MSVHSGKLNPEKFQQDFDSIEDVDNWIQKIMTNNFGWEDYK